MDTNTNTSTRTSSIWNGDEYEHSPKSTQWANEIKSLRSSKTKTRRGWGKKIKRKQFKNKENETTFSLFASNANGIKGKLDSLMTNVNIFQPSCIILQETKLRFPGTVKIEGFQIFENLRECLGGGLLTAIDNNLNPVLISTGNEDF